MYRNLWVCVCVWEREREREYILGYKKTKNTSSLTGSSSTGFPYIIEQIYESKWYQTIYEVISIKLSMPRNVKS